MASTRHPGQGFTPGELPGFSMTIDHWLVVAPIAAALALAALLIWLVGGG